MKPLERGAGEVIAKQALGCAFHLAARSKVTEVLQVTQASVNEPIIKKNFLDIFPTQRTL